MLISGDAIADNGSIFPPLRDKRCLPCHVKYECAQDGPIEEQVGGGGILSTIGVFSLIILVFGRYSTVFIGKVNTIQNERSSKIHVEIRAT